MHAPAPVTASLMDTAAIVYEPAAEPEPTAAPVCAVCADCAAALTRTDHTYGAARSCRCKRCQAKQARRMLRGEFSTTAQYRLDLACRAHPELTRAVVADRLHRDDLAQRHRRRQRPPTDFGPYKPRTRGTRGTRGTGAHVDPARAEQHRPASQPKRRKQQQTRSAA